MKRKPHIASYFTTFAENKSDILSYPERYAEHTVLEISVAALRTKDEETTDGGVGKHSSGAEIPDQWVAQKVNLTVILDPEILDT